MAFNEPVGFFKKGGLVERHKGTRSAHSTAILMPGEYVVPSENERSKKKPFKNKLSKELRDPRRLG